MNTWIKKNFNTLLIIFILLQPILDLITGIGIHVWKVNLTIGIIIRILFLIFMIYSVLFVYKKKQNFIYYGLLIIYGLFYLTGIFLYKDGIGVFEEIQGLCRVFYFPVLLISLYSVKEEIRISKMTLMTVLVTYLVCILIPNCLNLGFASYEITKEGTLGFFNSANEISGIISLLTPIMLLIFINCKKIISILIISIIYLFVILTIGTKTPLLSLGITIFFVYLWFIYKEIKQKRIKRIGLSLIALIIFVTGIILILPRTNFYKNIKTHLDYLKLDNITEVFQDEALIDHFIFSQRLTFLKDRQQDYKSATTYQKLFGIGYLDGAKEAKAVEMDYFDIYYSHGLIGFIIYFGIYGYIFYLIMKERKCLDFTQYMLYVSIILSIFLSFFTGHIITAPAVSLIVVILLLMLVKRKKDYILLIGENNQLERNLTHWVNETNPDKLKIEILLIEKNKSKQKNNLASSLEITKFPSTSNNILKQLMFMINLCWFEIANYQVYKRSCCYQNRDSLKEKLTKIASIDNNIYMDKTNLKNKFIKELLNKSVNVNFIFNNAKNKDAFLLKYPNLKEKCFLLDRLS